MLKIDLHSHTIASGHAFNTIYEMAESASKKGIKILGITDHGPSDPRSTSYSYIHTIGRLPRKLFGIKILYGLELNILNEKGKVDFPEDCAEKVDFLSASLHKTQYKGKDTMSTTAFVNAIKNPLISVYTHPYADGPSIDIKEVAQAACDNNKLLEISTVHFEFGDNLENGNFERLVEMIKVIKKNKFKVLVSSDAHVATELGIDKGFKKAMPKLGLTSKDIANNDTNYLRKFIKKI